jgi:hypothetical protein
LTCDGRGVVFKFKATMMKSMRPVREMMKTIMISEGKNIMLKMDAVYMKTALQGSHKALGSLAMLHHECRHMAAHLRETYKEPTNMKDSQETTELWLMTSFASGDMTTVGNVSSVQHRGKCTGTARDGTGRDRAYTTPKKASEPPTRTGRVKRHFRRKSSSYDAVQLHLGGNGRPNTLVYQMYITKNAST